MGKGHFQDTHSLILLNLNNDRAVLYPNLLQCVLCLDHTEDA